MTGEQMFNLMMGRLGKRTNPNLRATCVLEAQYVQEFELESAPVLPWFLITENASATLTVNERRVEVPTDFLRELEEEGELEIVLSDGTRRTLKKKTWDENLNWHGAEATADAPENYSLVGKYFMIFPLPTLALSLRMRYYAKDTLVADSSVETLWLKYAADLLLSKAGYRVSSFHLRDTEKAAEFAADITRAEKRLSDVETARAEANLSRKMG